MRFNILAFQLLASMVLPIQLYAREASLTAAFSPRQGATELVVETIEEAKEVIHVAAYSFTSDPIAEALVNAQKRGVEVKVILDKSQRKSPHSNYNYLKEQGVPVRINSHYAIMHNKFMVIDRKMVELGSFNYTKAAEEKNAENVLVVRHSPQVVKDYSRQWIKLWREAEPD